MTVHGCVRGKEDELLDLMEIVCGGNGEAAIPPPPSLNKTDGWTAAPDFVVVAATADVAASEQLKEEVAALQKALADLAEEQAEMDKIREETHAAYVTAKADLEQGIQGVQQALALPLVRPHKGTD